MRKKSSFENYNFLLSIFTARVISSSATIPSFFSGTQSLRQFSSDVPGYGHITPSTNPGRLITIVYAIFGIPIFLILLADFGKMFTRGIKFLWAFVRRLYYTGSCRKVRRTAPVQVSEMVNGAANEPVCETKKKREFIESGYETKLYRTTLQKP